MGDFQERDCLLQELEELQRCFLCVACPPGRVQCVCVLAVCSLRFERRACLQLQKLSPLSKEATRCVWETKDHSTRASGASGASDGVPTSLPAVYQPPTNEYRACLDRDFAVWADSIIEIPKNN